MHEQQQHEMVLEQTYPSGAEEWYCPLCDRRLLVLNWHPQAKQIVVKSGDEHALHIKLQASPEEDPRLAPWLAWLDDIDLDTDGL